MKSMGKLSAAVFAAVLFLTPCAFGQGTPNHMGLVMNAPALFTLPVVLDNQNGNNGCSKQANQGWWDWGFRDDNQGGCKTVPEGGTTLTYLSLAGIFCVGAFVLRPRREKANS